MYAVIDTEGSGLFRYKDDAGVPIPADAEGQPRMAALAMIFCDENFNVERVYSAFVRPDGWEMQPDATAVNGLTTDYLNEHGFPIKEVMGEFQNAVLEGRIVVAFNSQHDLKQCRSELRKLGMDDLFEQTPNICVMRGCMGLFKKPDGKGGWPKLSHACDHFGIVQPKQHTAEHDADAARQIALRLKAIERLPKPSVHYAKKHPGRASTDA